MNEAIILGKILEAINRRRETIGDKAWPYSRPLTLRKLHWSQHLKPMLGNEFYTLNKFARSGNRAIGMCVDGKILNCEATELLEHALVEIIDCNKPSDLPGVMTYEVGIQTAEPLTIPKVTTGIKGDKEPPYRYFRTHKSKSIKLSKVLEVFETRPKETYSDEAWEVKKEIEQAMQPITLIKTDFIEKLRNASMYADGV